MKWNELSIKDKSKLIQIAVQNKITNLNTIRDIYNTFGEGGDTDEDYKPKAYARKAGEIPLEYRDPDIDYEKHKDVDIYVDERGIPIQGNARESHNISNLTRWKAPLSNAPYQDNLNRIVASEVNKMARIEADLADNERIKNQVIGGIEELARNAPILGDMFDVYDISNDIYNGRYEAGIAGLALKFMPFDRIIGHTVDFAKDVYHAIGNHPIDKFNINRIARDAYNKGLIEDLSEVHKRKIKRGDSFETTPENFIIPRGYTPKQDKGFSMRHEIAHADQTEDNLLQFYNSKLFSPDYRYNRDIGDGVIVGNNGFPVELTEQRADYIGTLGGELYDKDVIKLMNTPNGRARVVSNPHIFKPSGEYLTWEPKDWFSLRSDKKYDQEDVNSLFSHVSEYIDLEQQLKHTDEYKSWLGDPRSYIQLNSKAAKSYLEGSALPNTILVHSSPNKFHNYRYSEFGRTDDGFYGRGFYHHPATSYEENLKRYTHPQSYGDEYYNLVTRVNKPLFPRSMNDQRWQEAYLFNRENTIGNYDLTSFDSVVTVPLDKVKERHGAMYPEIVVKDPKDVKSIIGNNGDFSLDIENFYKRYGGYLNKY